MGKINFSVWLALLTYICKKYILLYKKIFVNVILLDDINSRQPDSDVSELVGEVPQLMSH